MGPKSQEEFSHLISDIRGKKQSDLIPRAKAPGMEPLGMTSSG